MTQARPIEVLPWKFSYLSSGRKSSFVYTTLVRSCKSVAATQLFFLREWGLPQRRVAKGDRNRNPWICSSSWIKGTLSPTSLFLLAADLKQYMCFGFCWFKIHFSHLPLRVLLLLLSRSIMSNSFATPWTLDFSVHGISQASILEWVAITYSRGSSRSRDWTHASCLGRWILYLWATWEAPLTVVWSDCFSSF